MGTLAGLIVALAVVWPRGQSPAVSSGFQPYPAPDFTLVSHTGDSVSRSDFEGEAVALFFGYTNCPDVCPLTLAKLAEASAANSGPVTLGAANSGPVTLGAANSGPVTLGAANSGPVTLGAANSGPVTLLFVTVDPERDSAERLAEYLGAVDPNFIGLRGTVDEIRSVADSYGVYFEQSTEDDTMFGHSARTFLIDRDGRVAESFLHDASTEEIRVLLEVVATRR